MKVLKDNGVTTAIVDLGGNVYVLGHSPRGKDMDWTVGIQDPNKARNTVLGQVKESNKTLVTSGIYERYLKSMAKRTTISLIVKLAIRLITTSRVLPLSPTNPSMVMVSQQPSSQWASKRTRICRKSERNRCHFRHKRRQSLHQQRYRRQL